MGNVRKLRKPKPVTFEEAMKWLRRGFAIRRDAWHVRSRIFRVANEVYVSLPVNVSAHTEAQYSNAPQVWKPYPQDFLASDWRKV